MSKLSPQAQTVWEAFNEDEAGVFVDYGEKLAAALRAVIATCAYDDFGGHWIISPDDRERIATELEAK